jgi:hypothetical protein
VAECPKEALADATLPPMARIVLAVLWAYAGRGKRFVWPSVDTIAQAAGCTTRAAYRNLSLLRERLWIQPAQGRAGNKGWHLCDPPGTPVCTGDEADVGAIHPDAGVMNADASVTTPASRLTLASQNADASVNRISIGTNQEPTSRCKVGGSTVQGSAETPALAAAAARVDAIAWRADFAWQWTERFSGARGRAMVPSPVNGPTRLRALQEALDEFGGETVAKVLLYAGDAVQRRTEASGDERVGMHPGRLASAFRLEAGTFAVLLDEWQRETRQKRVSGRVPVAPAEIDGEPLTDEEQRVWMRASGDDPEGAVRRARVEAAEMADLFAGVVQGVTT